MAEENLSYCAMQVKNNDYDRYICSLFAPENKREKLFAIYAFNAEIARIKDIVTEPMSGYVRLQWWREAIDKIYAGQKPNHEIARQLFKLIHEVKIPKELFLELIDARLEELEFKQPLAMDELLKYSYDTSSKLIKLASHVMSDNETGSQKVIDDVGIAWALTGIMRSMRYNCSKHRVLIPKVYLDPYNVSAEDIIEGKKIRFSKDGIRMIVGEAEKRLNAANDEYKPELKELLPVLLPATIAKVYLDRIKKNDFNLFTKDLETGYGGIHFKLAANSMIGRF